MPTSYNRPGGWRGIFAPTATEQIIGVEDKNGQDKRSTKTYISSEKAAIILGLIKNHAENVMRTVKALHYRRTGVELTDETAKKKFRGVRAWLDVHQQLADHFASNQGFSVKAAVRMATLEEDAGQKVESSIAAKTPNGHDGKTNGVVKVG